ncbi:MAG TPA: hypothetical protein VF691_00295 [Cytophagaceae bacterium]|jgi:23S rRNA-/tRNA-specific pseudouridylate synthase
MATFVKWTYKYILFEDEYILVINKPGGLMVEPDRNGHPNLLLIVRKYIKIHWAGERKSMLNIFID